MERRCTLDRLNHNQHQLPHQHLHHLHHPHLRQLQMHLVSLQNNKACNTPTSTILAMSTDHNEMLTNETGTRAQILGQNIRAKGETMVTANHLMVQEKEKEDLAQAHLISLAAAHQGFPVITLMKTFSSTDLLARSIVQIGAL